MRLLVLSRNVSLYSTSRLVLDPKAMGSDPSHVVGLADRKEVDRELIGWLKKAYDRAEPGKTAPGRGTKPKSGGSSS